MPVSVNPGGFVCPLCGAADHSLVVDSRAFPTAIRRRRQCLKCHERFTTYERLAETVTLMRARAQTAAGQLRTIATALDRITEI